MSKHQATRPCAAGDFVQLDERQPGGDRLGIPELADEKAMG